MKVNITSIVEMGNEIHEYLSVNSKLSDSKTPTVIDKTINFIDSHDQYFVFINLVFYRYIYCVK